MPSQESPSIETYGDSLLTTLQKHLGEPKAAKTLDRPEQIALRHQLLCQMKQTLNEKIINALLLIILSKESVLIENSNTRLQRSSSDLR